MPELFHGKAEFDAYVAALVKAGVIADSSFIWWAMRPSLGHPTLELRAPDSCTLIGDSIANAALFRVLSRRLYRDVRSTPTSTRWGAPSQSRTNGGRSVTAYTVPLSARTVP